MVQGELVSDFLDQVDYFVEPGCECEDLVGIERRHECPTDSQDVGYMDEAAAVAAIRYARGSVLTAHVDAIDFRTPVPIGCFLEAIARVVAVGRTSMTVDVILEAENRHTAVRTITTTGRFVLVAIDAEGHPREVG
jgi:hypothetical protein